MATAEHDCAFPDEACSSCERDTEALAYALSAHFLAHPDGDSDPEGERDADADAEHACHNCDGIDPDTCLSNPARRGVQRAACTCEGFFPYLCPDGGHTEDDVDDEHDGCCGCPEDGGDRDSR